MDTEVAESESGAEDDIIVMAEVDSEKSGNKQAVSIDNNEYTFGLVVRYGITQNCGRT